MDSSRTYNRGFVPHHSLTTPVSSSKYLKFQSRLNYEAIYRIGDEPNVSELFLNCYLSSFTSSVTISVNLINSRKG